MSASATAAVHADILLVGGGVASVRCARTLRRQGFTGSIVLVADESHAPYNRPPLSKEGLRDEVPFDLLAAEPASWYQRRGIDLRTDVAVTRLLPAERLADLSDGSRVSWDRCLLATGAAPRRPPVPGASDALLLRTADDVVVLRGAARAGSRGLVIGGGFIGVEVAASLAARGVDVTVVEMADALWGAAYGADLSAWAADELREAGVTIQLQTRVEAIEGDAVRVAGERLPADFVVAGVGVAPRDELARQAGLATDDGIVTDGGHATSEAGVWAAGDVARVAGRRIEHWHAAREGGERAALAMLGLPVSAAPAPWVFSEFAGQQLDVVGWAPTWDATVLHGDVQGGRFHVAYVDDGIVVQLAIVNGALPVEQARRLISSRPPPDRLSELSPG